MKTKIFLIITLTIFIFVGNLFADAITLPDGRKLNIDNLSSNEINQAIETSRKSLKSQNENSTIIDIVKNTKPIDLQAWSKVISDTIKNVCTDLNITVNEFVKTPVGMGISFLIVYKVIGKDLLDNAMDVIIMIPLWFIMTGINLFLGWYFFSIKTVYDITYNEKGKKIKQNPKRIERYPWKPPAIKNDMSTKSLFAFFLVGIELVGTGLTLMIIL